MWVFVVSKISVTQLNQIKQTHSTYFAKQCDGLAEKKCLVKVMSCIYFGVNKDTKPPNHGGSKRHKKTTTGSKIELEIQTEIKMSDKTREPSEQKSTP